MAESATDGGTNEIRSGNELKVNESSWSLTHAKECRPAAGSMGGLTDLSSVRCRRIVRVGLASCGPLLRLVYRRQQLDHHRLCAAHASRGPADGSHRRVAQRFAQRRRQTLLGATVKRRRGRTARAQRQCRVEEKDEQAPEVAARKENPARGARSASGAAGTRAPDARARSVHKASNSASTC